MPEGPELCISSRFVNTVCKGRLFTGKVVKSSVSKCLDVDFSSNAYTISSQSRGKEMALTLQCTLEPLNKLRLLFRFGMSGKFVYVAQNEVPKHAHLKFFSRPSSCESAGGVLSFVDVRRFGSWHVTPVGWGENRGPDPMFDYEAFRSNVLDNLNDSAFNRPMCEALLNQKYFNGIGNYLRAEILFHVSVPPFTCARKVLEPLSQERGDCEGKKEDILWYCHKLPQEVVDLKHKLGKSETSAVTEDDYRAFCRWLKCYENPSMKTAKDSNGRTVWFKGEAGAMCSASQRSRGPRRRRKAGGPKPSKTEPTVKEEAADFKEGCGEIVEVQREEKASVSRMAIKEEDVLTESMVKSDEETHMISAGTRNTKSTKRRKKTTLDESSIQDGPPAKRLKTLVTDLKSAGGRAHRVKRGFTSRQHSSLPTRRSTRIKAAEMKKK